MTTTKDIPCSRLRLVVYCPHRDVSWSLTFQETVERTLNQDIAKIVKSIKSSTAIFLNEIREAEHRAEVREQEWKQQQERWRQAEDQRQITKSIADSREQLGEVIQASAKIASIEQFFKGVEERTADLPETERQSAQERLRLARELIGVQDPPAFFLSWKLPGERYTPLAQRTADEKLPMFLRSPSSKGTFSATATMCDIWRERSVSISTCCENGTIQSFTGSWSVQNVRI